MHKKLNFHQKTKYQIPMIVQAKFDGEACNASDVKETCENFSDAFVNLKLKQISELADVNEIHAEPKFHAAVESLDLKGSVSVYGGIARMTIDLYKVRPKMTVVFLNFL